MSAVSPYPIRVEGKLDPQLSRWLWLVKWLLAIPHFIVLFALLFTTRYPRGIFDFVMGLNRWVFRAWAYAALMTDAYPPFRLDQGGEDRGVSAPEGAPPASP